MNIPSSTYRIQLHKEFTFSQLQGIIDYMETLGISTIYAAPIVQATPGSMHGYDVTNPHSINPEIGTLDELRKISDVLKQKGMTWLQDIVPNHMAFHAQNFRLMDVMERGESSPYYHYFDINWQHHAPHLKGKLQVPFLGEELATCIKNNDLKIAFSENGFTADYFQTSYPLSVCAYDILAGKAGLDISFENFISDSRKIKPHDDWRKKKDDFIWSILKDEKKHRAVLEALERVNNNKAALEQVFDAQYYVLAYWKQSEREIGYRRFFTVNELICLRMEDQSVFDEYHVFLHDLYKDGIIHGLRIDHIDGLNDPSQYLNALRERFGSDCYIIAEKILEAREAMPGHWPLQGTSGYEFLSHVSQLITNRKGARELVAFYKELVPDVQPYHDLVIGNKRRILEQSMGGEWDNLVHYFSQLGLAADFDPDKIKLALGHFMVSLPVYRIYPERLPLTGNDIVIMKQTFDKAISIGNDCRAALENLRQLFMGAHDNADMRDRVLLFLKRLMQFTGPLTAKGVEDTTFYIYNPLISHDEVGDAPSTMGISISNFHAKMVERQKTSPSSLNATATHDTKRGEDARLRLNVLCEYPDQWKQLVSQWIEANKRSKKRTSKGKLAPSINDEYYIYQSVVGGFPEDFTLTPEWMKRLQAYLTKVVREAKVNSNWAEPDEEYEQACSSFIQAILSPESDFLNTFLPFIKKVSAMAGRYALGQALIKITAPGIPDTYQGCELWDLSFVDPDNRRPVDYEKRQGLLRQLIQKEKEGVHVLFPYLEDKRSEGVEKLFVTWKALNFRKHKPDLFMEGIYIPLQLTGQDTITVAFARNHKSDWALILVPLTVREKQGDPSDLFSADEVMLPQGAPGLWRNVFTNETVQTNGKLLLSACFTRFPVALFTSY